jgi:hypothetical protein
LIVRTADLSALRGFDDIPLILVITRIGKGNEVVMSLKSRKEEKL